jgi:hypothetical protein
MRRFIIFALVAGTAVYLVTRAHRRDRQTAEELRARSTWEDEGGAPEPVTF